LDAISDNILAMTLQDLFKQYGIHRPSDLVSAVGIHRQHAYMIWHGQRGVGAKLALRLFERTGIPLEALLRATAASQPAPRGRPRKPRQTPTES
jgi:plasmid maintenance system antidote protein VapI